MKKNTLLYLDPEVVRKAKREGLNISKITEETLMERLQIKAHGKAGLYRNLLELKKDWGFACLSLKLKNVKLKNIGPFNDFCASFSPGMNLILGPNGSGKSVIIRSLLLCLGGETDYSLRKMVFYGSNKGSIELEMWPDKSILLEASSSGTMDDIEWLKNDVSNASCILLDGPFPICPQEMVVKFLKELSSKGNQVITTSADAGMAKLLGGKVNVIEVGKNGSG